MGDQFPDQQTIAESAFGRTAMVDHRCCNGFDERWPFLWYLSCNESLASGSCRSIALRVDHSSFCGWHALPQRVSPHHRFSHPVEKICLARSEHEYRHFLAQASI